MMSTINLNTQVRVKISEEGERIWHEFHKGVPPQYLTLRKDGDGYTKLMLWEVMQVFGPTISMGTTPVIGMDIRID